MKKAKTDMIGGAYLWASLQAHRVMSEYLAADFRHHPSVAPVITIHLYSHRVPVSIYEARSRKVDAELKRIGKSVKTANTTQDPAIGRVLERRPATPDEGSAKRRRVAVKDLAEGVTGAVVTTVWGIPQGLVSLEYKLRFGVICDAHPVWGWSGPLMRGKLS
jgi:hypothetical protein